MKVLITGGDGFVGKHLVDYLLSLGEDVSTLDGDIRDYENCRNEIDHIRPDHIYHLAAQAYVPESFTNPKRTIEVNTIGSLNLLEAVRQVGTKAKVLLVGTSEEYGDSLNSELDLPNPKSPYAISKLAMDYLGLWYAATYGLNIVITRAFNHTGPGRGEMYAESSFAKQIALIEANKQKAVLHGNLEAIRNYTDVRDIIKAYKLAIDLPSDRYNICSSQNYSIREILAILTNYSSHTIKTESDSGRYRPSDFSFIKPSADKFESLTGWEPKISIGQTLEDLLNYWRQRV